MSDVGPLPDGTMLRRAPGLVVHLDSSNGCRIFWHGQWLYTNRHTLAVLSVLDRDRPIEAVFELLLRQLANESAVIEALSCVNSLIESGVIRINDSPGFTSEFYPLGGYDSEYIHITMLNDRYRKSRFIAGVQSEIGPDDVVVDLGTGSGILAIAAARAGARHVYAIEPSGVAELAEQAIAKNGFQEKITVLRGWATDITLPEQADVLITDIVGNDPFDMSLLEVVADARERLLRPDARVLPSELELFAYAVQVPTETIDRYCVSEQALRNWNEWYEIDFSPLLGARPKQFRFYERPEVAAGWTARSEPIQLGEVSLMGAIQPRFGWETELEVEPPFNAIVGFFRARIGTEVLTSYPAAGSADSHWYSPVWAHSEQITAGRVRVSYQYVAEGRSVVTIEESP